MLFSFLNSISDIILVPGEGDLGSTKLEWDAFLLKEERSLINEAPSISLKFWSYLRSWGFGFRLIELYFGSVFEGNFWLEYFSTEPEIFDIEVFSSVFFAVWTFTILVL